MVPSALGPSSGALHRLDSQVAPVPLVVGVNGEQQGRLEALIDVADGCQSSGPSCSFLIVVLAFRHRGRHPVAGRQEGTKKRDSSERGSGHR